MYLDVLMVFCKNYTTLRHNFVVVTSSLKLHVPSLSVGPDCDLE